MSKVTYLNTDSPRPKDVWTPTTIPIDQLPFNAQHKRTIIGYITESFNKNGIYSIDIDEITSKVSQSAENHFNAFGTTLIDYSISQERIVDEEYSKESARNDEIVSKVEKSKTRKRETKYTNNKYTPWYKHGLFMYIFYAAIPMLALVTAMLFMASIIVSSSIIQMFTENPFLALLISTAPVLGAGVLKAGDLLFATDKGKWRYALTLFIISLGLITGVIITYGEVFEGSGASIESLFEENTLEANPLYFKLWLIFQLLLEVVVGAFIAIIAQKVYQSTLHKDSVENVDFIGCLEDEREAQYNIRIFDNNIGTLKGYMKHTDSIREAYIDQWISYMHEILHELIADHSSTLRTLKIGLSHESIQNNLYIVDDKD